MWTTLEPEIVARLPRPAMNGTATASPSSETVEIAEGWEACIDKLLEYRRYEPDWDGLKTPPPDPETVDSAIILAVLLRQSRFNPPSWTVPGFDGSVGFEWQWPDKTILEVDVVEPFVADLFLHTPDRETEHWRLKGSCSGFESAAPAGADQ